MPLFADICNVSFSDEAVRWGHMYTLMDRLRSAAADMGIPYTSPVTTPDNPFYYEDIIPYTLYQTFELSSGVITKAYLSRWAKTLTPWDFGPTPLDDLETNDELMFLSDEDGCWCKTLWQITKVNGRPTLKETTTLKNGCCQTIPVPVKGDDLGPGQVFIPTGAAGLSSQADAEGWLSGPKCRTADSSDGLFFLKEGGVITAVQRQVKGHITWLIKPRHFQMILDNIETVVAGSCGSQAGVFPHLCRAHLASPPTLAEMVLAMETGGSPLFERFLPGCLQRDGCSVALPWEGLTCGGENCDGSDAPKLYCTTMQYLNGLIGRLPSWLCPPPCLQWSDFDSSITKHADATVTFTPGSPATLVVELPPQLACGGASSSRYVHGTLNLLVPGAGACKNGRLRVTVSGTGSAYTGIEVTNGTDVLSMAGSGTESCSAGPLVVDAGANPVELQVQAGVSLSCVVYDNLGGASAPESYNRGTISVTMTLELLVP